LASVNTAQGDTATAIGRSFVTSICPYDWRTPPRYGDAVNAALHTYAAPQFAATRRWSATRTTSAAAGLRARQASQRCGLITGGVMSEQPNTADTLYLRFSVTVTVTASDATPSLAQQVFLLTMRRITGRWLIADGQW